MRVPPQLAVIASVSFLQYVLFFMSIVQKLDMIKLNILAKLQKSFWHESCFYKWQVSEASVL